MALNPACTPGRVVPDPAVEGQHAALCGCGWSEGGFPSRSAAKRAQREHRFPPRTETSTALAFQPPQFLRASRPKPQIQITVTEPPPPRALHPCQMGQHRPAYLARGGIACGVCGAPL